MSKEIEQIIKDQIGNWVVNHTQVCFIGDDTLEIATSEKDSLGETVYCFIQKSNDVYRIGDDSRTLFKIDPSANDEELYAMTEEVAKSAGFDFDYNTGEIWKEVSRANVIEMIMKLTQLVVAVSYLG